MASVGERAASSAAALGASEVARGEAEVRAAQLEGELAAVTDRAGRAETVVASLQEQLDQAHDITSQQTAQLKQVSTRARAQTLANALLHACHHAVPNLGCRPSCV